MSSHDQAAQFYAPTGLSNAHLQTTLASVLRKARLRRELDHFVNDAPARIVDANGIRFRVHSHRVAATAPTIIIIPGWLGHSESGYALGSAAYLTAQGFNVIRINLRDHGGTAALNQGLFNSARLQEVLDLVDVLAAEADDPRLGVLGFSLGGNFALRIARARPQVRALGICPAIQPATTMLRIDQYLIYQRYFLRKWRKTWAQKQAAFPGVYDFREALQLNSVSALTDYFVRHQSDYPSTQAYFDAYDLSGAALAGVSAQILTTADDPIIELSQFDALPATIGIDVAPQGGHTALLKNWQMQSWVDEYAAAYFGRVLEDSTP